MTDVQPHEETRSDDLYRLYRWTTPVLLFAVGTIVAWIGTAIIHQQSTQNDTLTTIQVQLARMQDEESFAQGQVLSMQQQINAILNTQATHEHRITVLENTQTERRPRG